MTRRLTYGPVTLDRPKFHHDPNIDTRFMAAVIQSWTSARVKLTVVVTVIRA